MERKIAYVTDVEGNLDYFVRYVDSSKVMKWKNGKFDASNFDKSSLEFRDHDSEFVFGGDSQDKGIGDIRFVRLLLDLKKRYPDRVHFIMGNRDCNKLRLTTELSDEAINSNQVMTDDTFPYWVAEGKRVTPAMYLEKGKLQNDKANRLKWMLKDTMGSDGAFERRKLELQELTGRTDVSDVEVVSSYTREVDPEASEDNFMLQYLEQAKLAHLSGSTLFVHGGVNALNFGTVPGRGDSREADVAAWVSALNEWAQSEIEEYKRRPRAGTNTKTRAGHGLMDYGVPGGNDGRTVIYASHISNGNPVPLDEEVEEFLGRSGVSTLVVGHTPHGDCPAVVRSGRVTVVMSDTSYSKMGNVSKWGVDNRGEAAGEVLVRHDGSVEVEGVLSSGERVAYELPVAAAPRARESLVGERLQGGWWVKGRVRGGGDDGRFLLCKGEGFKLSFEREGRAEVEARLAEPLERSFHFVFGEDESGAADPAMLARRRTPWLLHALLLLTLLWAHCQIPRWTARGEVDEIEWSSGLFRKTFQTSLGKAVVGGDRAEVLRLLRVGADVHRRQQDEATLLHLAASSDQPEMVTLLLRAGADPLSTDKVAKGRVVEELLESAESGRRCGVDDRGRTDFAAAA